VLDRWRRHDGGQAGLSSRIGELSRLSHRRLGRRVDHVSADARPERFGRQVIFTTRKAVRLQRGPAGRRARSNSRTARRQRPGVILATGVDYRPVAGDRCWDDPDNPACQLRRSRVFYGASVSDARNASGEDVYIVGGANPAGQAADVHVPHSEIVTLLVRGPRWRHRCPTT